MQYTHIEIQELLEDEVAAMGNNLFVSWRPRVNGTLFKDLLEQQMQVWADEIEDAIYYWSDGAVEAPLELHEHTLAPADWFNGDGELEIYLAVHYGGSDAERAANRLAYDVAQIVNVQCAGVVGMIPQWWDSLQQREG